MPRNFVNQALRWLNPKDHDRNLISAAFHMICITLISMSMADLTWFTISAGVCTPTLTLGQFFWFGYLDTKLDGEYECINSTIVNMMRIIILLSFMAIIFSLGGFFLDILGPKCVMYRIVRRYAVPSICTVFWITLTISISYYVVLLLEDSLGRLYPKVDTTVSYGSGFHLITATGGLTLFGIFYILILMHHPPDNFRSDDRCLIDNYDDGSDSFSSPTPPPPYNVPPPPYTP